MYNIAVILPRVLFVQISPNLVTHPVCSLPVHLAGMWRQSSLHKAGQQQSSNFQYWNLLSGWAARQAYSWEHSSINLIWWVDSNNMNLSISRKSWGFDTMAWKAVKRQSNKSKFCLVDVWAMLIKPPTCIQGRIWHTKTCPIFLPV